MLALAALGVTAAGASAGTLSASGSTVTFKAKAGETNRVKITQTGNSVEVTDNAVIPTAGAGCTGVPVHCDLARLTEVVVDLGNKNDTLDASAVQVKLDVDAGSGDDDLTTGSHADDVDLGSGDDSIDAGDGNDTIDGETGVDFIHGQKGADDIFGGAADDHLFGEDGNDDLRGNDGEDHLTGGADNDTPGGRRQRRRADRQRRQGQVRGERRLRHDQRRRRDRRRERRLRIDPVRRRLRPRGPGRRRQQRLRPRQALTASRPAAFRGGPRPVPPPPRGSCAQSPGTRI